MLALPRLPIERQRNVGRALADVFNDEVSYKPEVVGRAKTVIAATEGLEDPGGHSMFSVDRATDSVITAIYRALDAWTKGLTDAVLPLEPEQQAALAAAEVLDSAWFPDGIEFVHEVVGLQHDALAGIQKTLAKKEIKDAVETLGLGPMVAHLSRHTALYAKTLGLTAEGEAGAPESGPSQTWHDAYMLFAASVVTSYSDDAETRKVLLGSYESQLREHRAAMRKERRKRAREQK